MSNARKSTTELCRYPQPVAYDFRGSAQETRHNPEVGIMRCLMEKAGINFFGAGEKLARGQGDAIRDRAVERLRSGVLNLRGVGHSGDDPLGRLDGIVLMRLDLRQLIEDCWRKLALLKIEEPIVSKDETPTGFVIGFVL